MAKKSPSKLKKTKSVSKPAPTLDYEREAGFPFSRVIGVDEVGRGCLAGPVVAGAVLLPKDWFLPMNELIETYPMIGKITDSKKLDSKTREKLAPWIRENVSAYGIGWCSVQEIDELNIFHASLRAMVRAAEALGSFSHVLVDGKFIPKDWAAIQTGAGKASAIATPIIKGDLHSLSIACASILAKVYRDEWMDRLSLEYPGYGFEIHKGYFTPQHQKALKELGVSAIHRRSYAPVREAMGLEFRKGPLNEIIQSPSEFEVFDGSVP